jgi:hypothetical protein
MKKIYYLFALLILGASINPTPTNAQVTTVFVDTFDGEFFAGPGGDPAITMTPNAGPVGAYPYSYSQIGGFDWYATTFFDPGHLTNWGDDDFSSPPSTWQWTSGPLSGYAAPYALKLNLNTGLVEWAFNMSMSTPQTGNFDVFDDEAIVMLAGTDDRLFTTIGPFATQGYAITMTSAPPYGVRLIKYDGGISGSSTYTPPTELIPSTSAAGVTSPTNYLSVRVTFDPTSNRWSLYVRDDGPFGFANPWTGVNTLVGTVVDAEFTATTMARFGFYSHFDMTPGVGVKFAEFDNFRVTITCALPVQGNPDICVGQTTSLYDLTAGGTWSSLNPTVADVDAGGIVTGYIPGTATIRYTTSPTCWADTIVNVLPLPTITGPLTTCIGQPSTVNVTPAGGTWSSTPGGAGTIDATTGGFTGITGPDTVTLTYTSLIGCISTAVGTINVLPPAIGGTRTVCESGGTTTLTNGTPSGTWSASSPNFSINSSTGVVSGIVAAGTSPATGTVTYTAPTGCYVTAIVTVNPLPNNITGSLAVCLNSTTALANATAGGGTWSSSPITTGTINSATGLAGGVAVGTFTTVFTSNVTGCKRSAVVTVNALPPASTGTFSVCVNGTTILSNTGGPGSWSSPSPNVTVNSFTGAVTGVTAGTATVIFTRTSTGCTASVVVTVNPLPSNITGSLTVCVNSTTNLNSGPVGGTWTSSNTAVGTISASTMPGVAGGIASGTTTISYSLSTGCRRTAILTVNPLPGAITGVNSVCVGYLSSLSGTPGGGTWQSSNGNVSVGLSTGVITGVTVGTSVITYRLSTGCYSTLVATTNITPSATVIPLGDTVLCPGGFVVLTGSTGSGYSYQWSESGTPISGATNSTLTVSTPGSYEVFISNGIGCAATSWPMTVTINPATATITPPSGGVVACSGGSVGLTANTGPGLSYQWLIGTPATPVAGATSSTFNATVNGNVKVVVTNSAGCSAEDSLSVTINPLPSTAISVSGPVTFCQGSSAVLSVPTVPGYTYQWFNGSVPIAGATAANYTATVSGSYSVTVTNSFACSANSSATLITVNPLPDVTVGHVTPTVFCPGGSVTLTAAASVGFVYQWYKAGVPITGATNFNYVATASGGYRVRITNSNTGCIGMTLADTVVTVLSSATIVPLTPADFCWGGNAMLSTSATGLPYVTYQWYLNGSPISGANSSTYLATVAGIYTCKITPPGGCFVSTPNLVVIEHPLPNPVITYNTVTGVMYTSSSYITYQWYKNTLVIPGATSWSMYPSGNGDYRVAVTDSNGCQSFSSIYQLKNWIGPNGVSNIGNGGEIHIYPNPASSSVHVEAQGAVHVVISGVDGKSLIDVNSTDINIGQLADGVYMISVYNIDGQKLKVEKLVKTSN